MLRLKLFLYLLLLVSSLEELYGQSGDKLGTIFVLQNPFDTINEKAIKESYRIKVMDHLGQFELQKIENRQRKKMNELKHFEERLSSFLKYGLDDT
jgi:hypothetical protein